MATNGRWKTWWCFRHVAGKSTQLLLCFIKLPVVWKWESSGWKNDHKSWESSWSEKDEGTIVWKHRKTEQKQKTKQQAAMNDSRVKRQRREFVMEEKARAQQCGSIAVGKQRRRELFISTSTAADIAESSFLQRTAAGGKKGLWHYRLHHYSSVSSLSQHKMNAAACIT